MPLFAIGLPLLRLFLMMILPEAKNKEYYRNVPTLVGKEYDFIVVGSGSAGAVVGARLAEVKSWNVLVLEAGSIPGAETYVPGLHTLLTNTKYDWQYQTTPQKHSMIGYRNRSNHYPRGKVLGGSTTINFLMYVRGNRRDFDGWASMGNEGWDYESVLPYFKKSEDYRGPLRSEDAHFHSRGGPMSVEKKIFSTPCSGAFIEAGDELGYPSGIDPNAKEQTGFTVPDLTVRNGVRESVAEAFLKPNMYKSNFDVFPDATVIQVLVNENKRAIGVKYVHGKKVRVAYARKEVILSAGAVDSPKLLMLSGIGPREHLEKHKIPVKVDLPGVGQNFHDQPVIFGLTWIVDKGAAYSFSTALLNKSAYIDYHYNKQGPYSVPMAVEGNFWVQISEGDPLYADLQVLMMSVSPAIDYGFAFADTIGYRRELFDDYFRDLFNTENFSLGPTLLRPKSRGSVTLRSNNPFEQPNIDPNFFAHPEDLEFFVRAIKFCLKFGETKAMKKLGARFYDKPLLGCKHIEIGSDEYWRCFTRQLASTIYHPAGSCKMAPHSDPMGVVDNKLRLRGVAGLRVIDASIMPLVTSGNTNAPAIMIGEKGADMIKQDYLKYS